jgi:hypothetical protein
VLSPRRSPAGSAQVRSPSSSGRSRWQGPRRVGVPSRSARVGTASAADLSRRQPSSAANGGRGRSGAGRDRPSRTAARAQWMARTASSALSSTRARPPSSACTGRGASRLRALAAVHHSENSALGQTRRAYYVGFVRGSIICGDSRTRRLVSDTDDQPARKRRADSRPPPSRARAHAAGPSPAASELSPWRQACQDPDRPERGPNGGSAS